MTTNRSINPLRILLFAALAVGFSASLAHAQNFTGTFTLPFEARWGLASLPPGDYSFTMDPASDPCIAKVSRGTKAIAMVLANSNRSETAGVHSSALIAVRIGNTYRIRELRLAEAGVAIEYAPPMAERRLWANNSEPVLYRRIPVLVAGK